MIVQPITTPKQAQQVVQLEINAWEMDPIDATPTHVLIAVAINGGPAANLAIASLPNFTLHSDISATERYWEADIINEIFTLNSEDSTITVPAGLGLGVTVNMEHVRNYLNRSITLRA